LRSGYEQLGGFQRVFQDNVGRAVKKLWTLIVTPDHTPYIAQISDVDGNAKASLVPIRSNS
jgi:branched-chain amino acid transport system substrate-binding protein